MSSAEYFIWAHAPLPINSATRGIHPVIFRSRKMKVDIGTIGLPTPSDHACDLTTRITEPSDGILTLYNEL
jgi:hypothetical protein